MSQMWDSGGRAAPSPHTAVSGDETPMAGSYRSSCDPGT